MFMLHTPTSRRMRKFTAVFMLVITLFSLAIPTVSAESYRATMYNGDIYNLNVGDTLYLTSSLSTDGLDLSARGWDLSRDDVVDIEYTANSKYATVTARAPGTVTVIALLDGSYKVAKTGTRYNYTTDKYESYTYYVYETIGTRSCFVTVRVADNEPPAIVTQPASKAFASGATATASVAATDHSALSYQWYVKEPGSTSFVKSSVTERVYSFTMTSAKSGRQVYCVITDALGNTTRSKTATLSQINITKQPTSKTVAPGVTVKTSVTATGSGLKYQWYFADPGSSSYSKSSATGTTYGFPMTAAKSGRQAYCVITDAYGNSMKTNTVILRQEFYATITKQPTNDFAASGKTVSTSVTATGDGLKYQWYVKEPGSSSFIKSSITDKTYSYSMTGAKSGRQAYCVVKDKYGNTVKSKTVTFSLLAITKQPANVAVASGQTAATTVTVSGSGLKYQWYFKDPGSSSFSKSSVTEKTYSCTMNAAKSGRKVYCIITDKYGNSIKSSTVTLRLPVSLTITKQPANAYATLGSTASTSVKVSGTGSLTYQWYYAPAGSSTFSKSSVTDATYSFTGRKVYCVIKDTYGNSVKTNTVTMKRIETLTITSQPVDTMVANGRDVSVSVAAKGEGPLSYQWYIKNTGDSSFSKSSITESTYSITMNENRAGRQVYCVISDRYGQKVQTNTVTLSMANPLIITKEPTDYYTSHNSTARFTVKASGSGPLTYQWYYCFLGDTYFSPLSKGTEASYSFKATRAINGNHYYCIIKDSYGQQVQTKTVWLYVS